MMKKFLLIVCGSFVGVTLALVFFVLSSIIFSIAMMSMGSSMGSKSIKVQKNSILHLNLKGEIPEREGDADMSLISLMQGGMDGGTASLPVLIEAIKNAKENDNIKGIYMECNGSLAAPATRFALRKALADFKQSGKWIYAYAYQGYDQGDYYLASLADSIFLNPVGAVDVHGMASATTYMKRLLDKVGVEMQIIRVGTFKSAVEPYMLDSISPANRLQQEHYMGSIWGVMRDSIATARGIEPARFDQLTDSIIATIAADSLVQLHLVDALCYKPEMEARLKALTDVDKADDLRLVSPGDIATGGESGASGDHNAILYAVGEIDGQSSPLSGSGSGIDTKKLCKEIAKLQDDDHVKGLVLRVNSPGGSAFGSEQMWKALDEFKKSGKPFAVSMGDYAASGGYYISCGADRIFAEPTTITGSIGIFGIIPCYQELAENKLGVNVSVVKTNANADLGNTAKRLTPAQRAAMQNMVNRGYELFTSRCAEGRHMSQDSIKKIAEGRVWDGATAKEIGLVDAFGGLQDAIDWVAKKAKIKGEAKTQNYPALEDDWRMMLNRYMAVQYAEHLQSEMGIFYEYHRLLTSVLNRDAVQCIMEPIEIKF